MHSIRILKFLRYLLFYLGVPHGFGKRELFCARIIIIIFTLFCIYPLTLKSDVTNSVNKTVVTIQYYFIIVLYYANILPSFILFNSYSKYLIYTANFNVGSKTIGNQTLKSSNSRNLTLFMFGQFLALIYFTVSDFVLNVTEQNMNWMYWFKLRFPLMVNFLNLTYFCCLLMDVLIKFKCMEELFNKFCYPDIKSNNYAINSFKKFVHMYVELVESTEELNFYFNIPVLFTFFTTFIISTNNIFLMLKIQNLSKVVIYNLCNDFVSIVSILVVLILIFHIIKNRVSIFSLCDFC